MDKNPLKYVPGGPDKSLNEFFSAFKEMKLEAPIEHFSSLIANHSVKLGFWQIITQNILKLGIKGIYGFGAIAVLLTGYVLLQNYDEKTNKQTIHSTVKSGKTLSSIPLMDEADKYLSNTKKSIQSFKKAYTAKAPRAILASNSNVLQIERNPEIIENHVSPRSIDALSEMNINLAEPKIPDIGISLDKLAEDEHDFVIYEADGIKTLFNTYINKSQFWFAGIGKVAASGKKASIFNGAKFGCTINSSLSIGVFATQMETTSKMNIYTENAEQINGDLKMVYGGVFVERIFNPEDKLHYYANMSVSGGAYYVTNDGNSSVARPIISVEPGLGLEYNLFRSFRVGAEAQYRFVKDVNMYDRFPNSNINSILTNKFSLALFFKIGIL